MEGRRPARVPWRTQRPIIESGGIIEPLRDRIVGINQEITEDLAAAIQAAGIERVKIRSVCSPANPSAACASPVTAATWPPGAWWNAAKRSA
jgi:hypothetical protein